MKKLLILLACSLGLLTLVPSADAGYRRTIIGYDLSGRPIIRVVWVADHVDYPRTVFDRRTYPTSLRKDPDTLVPSYVPEFAPKPIVIYQAPTQPEPVYIEPER
jgi:hypothetical protein